MRCSREEQLYGLEKKGNAICTGEERNSSMGWCKEEQIERKSCMGWSREEYLYGLEKKGTTSSMGWNKEEQLYRVEKKGAALLVGVDKNR